jgi:hypothetical protein
MNQEPDETSPGDHDPRGGQAEAARTYPSGQPRPASYLEGGQDERAPTGDEDRRNWHRPLPATLPRPTAWPAVVAFGATLVAWGLITSWIISGVGFVVFAVATAGWVAELRHARYG